MWMKCSHIPDEPDKVGPLELVDAGVVLIIFGAVGFGSGIVLGGLVAGVCGYGIYRLKRGRPYGALLHRMHKLELVRLPGFLSPRRQRYSPG